MKIALVTCYFQHNYGSQLQAYATQWLFDELGVENETICIDGLKGDINSAKYRYFLSRLFDVATVRDKLPTLRLALAKRLFAKELNERGRRFDAFARDMFRLSSCYSSKAEFADKYDLFIIGSDQLWLPSNIEADYYTLSYVPDGIPKMSLATSFGVDSLPLRQARKAKAFLNRFDAISVRELGGQELVKSLIGKGAKLMPDPTLLFDAEAWNSKISGERIIKEPFIFCYFLGNNKLCRKSASFIKEKTGLPIVQIPHCDDYIASDNRLFDRAIYDAGPFDFIRLIRDAEFVLTDSFHATLFSILFGKEFFTFRRYAKDSSVSTNSRLSSLLTVLNLKDRFICNFAELGYALRVHHDFVETNKIIDALRKDAFDWVNEQLKRFRL